MGKPIGYAAAAAVGVGAAVFGLQYCGDNFERTESHVPAVQESTILRYQTRLKTCLGSLVTENTIPMPVKNKLGVHIPGTDWDPSIRWDDNYGAVAVGTLDFCVPGIVNIESSTRTSSTAPVGASDTVHVTIDRSKLFVDEPHVEFEPKPETYTVKDGLITERNGKKLIEPEAILAKDGKYKIGRSITEGQDSGLTDLVEAATLGNLNIGKDAVTNMNMVAELEAGRPKCIAAARKVVPFDKFAKQSFTNALTAQGYASNNVIVNFAPNSEWPSSTNIKDEDGLTYDERRDAVEEVLPGNQPISSKVSCKTGNIKDTTAVSNQAAKKDQ